MNKMIYLTCDEDRPDIIDVWCESPHRDDYTKAWWGNEDRSLNTLIDTIARGDCIAVYGLAPDDSKTLVVL